MMKNIIEYLKATYDPLAIIVYGSYANGTNDSESDFDALVISASCERFHDTSFFDGVQLDIFVYPEDYFNEDMELCDFVQLIDSEVLIDTDGIGENLKNRVVSYVNNLPRKSDADIKADIDWCVKMLARAKRGDAEGMFRWHWVLTDSLEMYCNVVHQFYRGPKKTLECMKQNHPDAYVIYKKALFEFNIDSLGEWISYLKDLWYGDK